MPDSTTFRRATITSTEMRWKSKRWQRERIVAGRRCGSVVASMNNGVRRRFLQRSLSSALNAPVESMCTSSTMYTLYFVTRPAET